MLAIRQCDVRVATRLWLSMSGVAKITTLMCYWRIAWCPATCTKSGVQCAMHVTQNNCTHQLVAAGKWLATSLACLILSWKWSHIKPFYVVLVLHLYCLCAFSYHMNFNNELRPWEWKSLICFHCPHALEAAAWEVHYFKKIALFPQKKALDPKKKNLI